MLKALKRLHLNCCDNTLDAFLVQLQPVIYIYFICIYRHTFMHYNLAFNKNAVMYCDRIPSEQFSVKELAQGHSSSNLAVVRLEPAIF